MRRFFIALLIGILGALSYHNANAGVTNPPFIFAPNVWTANNNFTGGLQIDGTTIVTPPGTTDVFLRGDGDWAAAGGGGAVAVGPAGSINFSDGAGAFDYETDASSPFYYSTIDQVLYINQINAPSGNNLQLRAPDGEALVSDDGFATFIGAGANLSGTAGVGGDVYIAGGGATGGDGGNVYLMPGDSIGGTSGKAYVGSDEILTTASTIPGGLTVLTAQATNNAAMYYDCAIPSSAKKVTISIDEVVKASTTRIKYQLLTGGAPVITGYTTLSIYLTSGTLSPSSDTTGVSMGNVDVSTNKHSGDVVFSLMDDADNTWSYTGTITVGPTSIVTAAGRVILTTPISGVRLTSTNGASPFTAGRVNCSYQ